MIPVPRTEVDRVLDGFQLWAEQMGEVFGPETKVADSDIDGYQDELRVRTPWGETRSILVAFFPSDGEGGGFGHFYERPIIKVFFQADHSWALYADARRMGLLKSLNSILQHEITHALEYYSHRPAIKGARATKQTELEDIPDPVGYFNDPQEVRAYTRSICEEFDRFDREMWAKRAARKFSSGEILRSILSASNPWRLIEPYLTEANKKRVIKGVVASLEEGAT